MGHVRLGELPRTRRWQQVVALIRAGAGVQQIANATTRAVEAAFRHAGRDPGVVEATWLLARLPFVARGPKFVEGLRSLGLQVSESPGLMEISAAVSTAVERAMTGRRNRLETDVGEMAQHALSSTLSAVIGPKLPNLFGTTTEEVRGALSGFATVVKFGELARHFFATFTNRCLNYCLSRELSNHIGPTERFASLAQTTAYTAALDTHCREAAVIVERYSGEWLWKENWQSGQQIERKAISNFTSYAMTKLTEELKRGAVNHA